MYQSDSAIDAVAVSGCTKRPRCDAAYYHQCHRQFLGLGWAATPAGLRAMKALSELNVENSRASTDMCTFLVINISSIQLIPVNIIAYRSQYGGV